MRGCAAAIYKQVVLAFLVNKKIRFNKAKSNILFISVPSIFTYLLYQLVLLNKEYCKGGLFENAASSGVQILELMFVVYMVGNRTIRTVKAIIKKKKSFKKPQNPENSER
jgi:hypothetical protein